MVYANKKTVFEGRIQLFSKIFYRQFQSGEGESRGNNYIATIVSQNVFHKRNSSSLIPVSLFAQSVVKQITLLVLRCAFMHT